MNIHSVIRHGNVTRIHLHPDFFSKNVHAMIPELKHINQTLQSLNSSIKVMHLLENQENNQNILPDLPAMPVCLFCQVNFHPSKSLNMGGRDWLINP